ncbi:MAG: hydrogenase nickel incorporation protein HypB [Chloroflexaceae bacterium]|nr:hydrogenase nickel incorporation protein HypB [Chloroflexaceae bacterium]
MSTLSTRLLEIRTGVLSKNDQLAARLRERFQAAGVLALNFVSSPGSGKTALLERTLAELVRAGRRPAALVGDLATDNDARRLERSGALVRQIETRDMCHLEAEMISAHLDAAGWNLAELDFLFIENVGNLVCPSGYDLGEQVRVVLLSVTEGEDKPVKYPVLFTSADVAIITKLDLAEACGIDLALMRRNIEEVRPGITIFETSARTGAGMDAWLAWLLARCVEG